MEQHFLHFNARETLAAAKAYEDHLAAGGKMLVTLAGAMSTAKIGTLLAPMIRAAESFASKPRDGEIAAVEAKTALEPLFVRGFAGA